ncbi:amidohydrolase family protein [Sciscionella marina]|uniref:amidohydrolase family protein n=1 Tax=Sciscionella marina TaxID=508770 RepID=UPI00039B9F9B|nr:amidohydrolase family protein [Sciscionella marina]
MSELVSGAHRDPRIVDVHAHFLPAAYRPVLETLTAKSGTPTATPESAAPEVRRVFAAMSDEPGMIDQRLDMMDDAGVARQILSPGSMAPYGREPRMAVEAARLLNDSYRELTGSRTTRFSSFVSLPLPHIDASLEELRRGLDELGMAGVALGCSVFDRSTAEAEFEPLYEEMNARGTTLFFHPCQNGICSPLINDYGFTTAAGASLEDTAIVLQLIKRNIPARYPDIKIIIPHLGGLIPMQLARLDAQASTPDLLGPPSVMARSLYYDTVGWGSQAALRCACEAFGADHLVPGSDFSALLAVESYARTFEYIKESRLSEQEIEKILYGNAPALFDFDKPIPV